MSRLYHVSDTPGIARFDPRRIGDGPETVWAIDEAHLVNYLTPRDCPRVCFCLGPRSRPEDAALLDGAAIVIAKSAASGARQRALVIVFIFSCP